MIDALAWRRRLGPLAPRYLRWRVEQLAPDYLLCTRHAVAAGLDTLRLLAAGRDSAFWYFDAATPLPGPVLALAQLTHRTFATYGFQVEALEAAGIPRVGFLPQGFDPAIDRREERFPASYMCDVSFVGSGQYPRRYRLLQAVARICRLQIRGPGWEKAPRDLPIAGGRLAGIELARAISAAKISLGIDALESQQAERRGGTSNRLWRVLGAGGLFLGEHVEGIERFARDGEQAVWYRSKQEAVARIRQLLTDAELRERIAGAGQAHAMAHHTYAHRLQLLLADQSYTSM